ncbi:hypothetical protein BDW02DRAFT_565609 [Decorospora gaudefroyi]|uniref:Ubiquitin interaction motif protein n=1 Tax=Decorospora gaudefroyi TaxID=184978 RepID=A0A6A5KRK4_9PLEO|nr:hypothetical protein BDW02DRAFT_565609 [Decorospora gaudefroyi]
MAASTEPTQSDLDTMLELTSAHLDWNEAKLLLASHNNDVGAALNRFLDSQDTGTIAALKTHLNSQAKWDETGFQGAMYGADEVTVPTFNIDYAPGYDNYPHSTVNSAAPSRPPSVASHRSAASTQAQAGDAPIQSIENQDSGVAGSNPNFRPATGTYDASEWALVSTAATEIIADPIPGQRKREEGEPAIIKPYSNFNYLPNLIPILHSIPLFRNALLCPGIQQKDYWMGDDWWRGSPTEQVARIFDNAVGRSETLGLDIIYEAQRLMAFLDNTDRIYGSVGALIESEAWKDAQSTLDDPDDDLLNFLVSWGFAFQRQVPDANLDGVIRSTVNVSGSIQESFVLDTTVTRHQSRPELSLYDVLDDALFSSAAGSAHLRDTSRVLILRLTSSNQAVADLGCRIPATLYVDRYLEENKPVIEGMYRDIEQHEEQLRLIQRQAERLRYHTPKKAGSRRVETLQLLRTSLAAYEPTVPAGSPEDAAVLSQLQELYQSIESKLATLEEWTRQVQMTIAGITGRFKPRLDDGADNAGDTAMKTIETGTENSAENSENLVHIDYPEGQTPEDAMKHPYYLHGVATRRDVVYVLHPDIKSDVPGATQWWRMQYDTESSNPIIRRDRLSLEEVIERATTEAGSALLVYAHKDALAVEPTLLPKPLEEFVKRDNLNFLEELQKNITGWESYPDYGNAIQGDWDKNPASDFDPDWCQISAQEFHKSRERNDSNMSSATLTPNTEIDDDAAGAQEMVETRRGTGITRSASSETVGRGDDATEAGVEKAQGKISFVDVDMADAHEEPRTQHIEVAEKKGG